MLGDIVVSYERMQEVEFSFFTLPDSGAFLTHAPRRLSEAFALLYPFQKEVWPALIFTIIITGPILYLMVAVPHWMLEKSKRKFQKPKTFFHMIYVREITRQSRLRIKRIILKDHYPQAKQKSTFGECVWFTCRIFLRQCKIETFFTSSIANARISFNFSHKFSARKQPFGSFLLNNPLAISNLRVEWFVFSTTHIAISTTIKRVAHWESSSSRVCCQSKQLSFACRTKLCLL